MKKILTVNLIIFLLISGSINAQDFWTEIPEPFWQMGSVGLYVAPNNNIIVSCGFYSMYYSYTHGESWETATGYEHNDINHYTTNSQGVIFGCCGNNCFGLWKSENNGVTWNEFIGSYVDLEDITVNSEDILFGIGPAGNQYISKSIDDGETWDVISTGFTNSKARVITVNDSDDLFVGTTSYGNGSGIYKSTDDGISWELISGELFEDSFIRFIEFGSNGDIFVGVDYGAVFRSSDGGNTWQNIFNKIGDSKSGPSDFDFNSKGDIYLLTSSGVNRSNDNGNTWVEVNSGLPLDKNSKLSSLNEIVIDGDDYIYGITNGDGMYRSALPTTLGIQDHLSGNNQLAIVNYPNPFSSHTKFQYFVPNKSFITLKVYDISGNEILSLVNEEKIKGEYIVDFEAEDFPAGLYFYLISDGFSASSGKMTIIK